MDEKPEKLNGKGAILTMSILAIICLIVGVLFMVVPYFTNGNNTHAAIQT